MSILHKYETKRTELEIHLFDLYVYIYMDVLVCMYMCIFIWINECVFIRV